MNGMDYHWKLLRAIFTKNQTVFQHFFSDPLQICPTFDILVTPPSENCVNFCFMNVTILRDMRLRNLHIFPKIFDN